MDLGLSGRRVLVSGSSAGIGEAIAVFLAAEGARVVVHGRAETRARSVAETIRAAGGDADVAIGDLSTDDGADAVVTEALRGGGIDILVNNAGTYQHRAWSELTAEQWLQTYQHNVASGVRLINRLVPGMRERGWGRVIQIGGGLAIQPIAAQPDYNATLAARHNMAVSLARELRGSGVTSNVVAPGAILVPSVEELLTRAAPEYGWGTTWAEIERGAVRDMVPNDVGRLGRPEEIAAAVAYLSSPYADYVSGAVLRVDGGTIRSV
ncbi:SDR family NAD(P)-dependent oxidoreductase [Pseudonocardia spinosispora]|uniref:SDR family NAD(P)-dependent oxidoreductase n=1 Tax=Pseudonocardia spinosispora TaxID=103441 RepID=UPI00041A34B4|nr:SDR family NAD(P)-dependent oxidoreductase [Pseudonocardia spinosispora]